MDPPAFLKPKQVIKSITQTANEAYESITIQNDDSMPVITEKEEQLEESKEEFKIENQVKQYE